MKNLKNSKNIYLIGIKGVGMTALAQFLKKQGYKVSGSDTHEIFFTDKILRKEKIKFFKGFSKKNIHEKINLVIHSPAYSKKDNVEMAEVAKRKIPTLDLAQATGEIFNSFRKNIAVCGTHGKSTTTALLAFVLKESGFNPSALIGSNVPQLKGNALSGKNDVMVIEADEYKNKLKHYNPYGVILNNIEYDHPDYFKNFNSYKKVFRDFVKRVPADGFVVANLEDRVVREVCKGIKVKVLSIKYKVLSIKNGYQIFSLNYKNKNLGEFKIKLFGEHNVQNAAAVVATCLELKVPLTKVKKALAKFNGLARRMEVLGKYNGATFVDDYAHHPTEIKATLKAARQKYYDKKIICAFMPHTFSRTKALFKDFSKSFSDADEVIILPIYGSAREKKGGVSSKDLLKAIKLYCHSNRSGGIPQVRENLKINKMLRDPSTPRSRSSLVAQDDKKIKYIPSIAQCAKHLKKQVNKNNVVILMGAGDTFRVWHQIKK